ncbi:MAG: radical SAM family RiPP maturation amino acid epimerase [Proteobacteria bacterium]|nr:radical SAM family RiPP maturation amino acid epimerase [Pseudomonadota bacterium]MBU1057258.1 radical SAM family RiPP maturation amino acid epimerase [Pseudomonadota bacterium]
MTQTFTIGETKRFLERWTAEPAFKQLIVKDPEQAIEQYNLAFHPEEIRMLWDRGFAMQSDPDQIPRPVQQYRDFIHEKFNHRDLLRDQSASSDPRITAWRKRQMMRCISQLGPEKHGSIVHAPFSVELNKGCSVGCWFCAYSAPKLSALYRYTPANKKLWQDTLRILREVWGESAKYGFCYWATEPLDNPDYEKFLSDFYQILGYFPQTTTAVPLRNIERTKKLLELSRQNKGFVERFSIHTLEKLEEVYRHFSADELKWVELVTQNEESDMAYANSGKILTGTNTNKAQIVINDSTIACVSGFLLNMVDKSVQLITPCISTSRWPKGYIIYDEVHFGSAEELREVLKQLIEKHMPTTLGRDQRVQFRPDLRMQVERDGFSLHLKQPTYTSAKPHPFLNSPARIMHPRLSDLGCLIALGNMTAGEMALYFEEKEFISPAETFHCLNTLFSFGLLKEGPD